MKGACWSVEDLEELSSIKSSDDVRRYSLKTGRSEEAIRRKLKLHTGRSVTGNFRRGGQGLRRRDRSNCVISCS